MSKKNYSSNDKDVIDGLLEEVHNLTQKISNDVDSNLTQHPDDFELSSENHNIQDTKTDIEAYEIGANETFEDESEIEAKLNETHKLEEKLPNENTTTNKIAKILPPPSTGGKDKAQLLKAEEY